MAIARGKIMSLPDAKWAATETTTGTHFADTTWTGKVIWRTPMLHPVAYTMGGLLAHWGIDPESAEASPVDAPNYLFDFRYRQYGTAYGTAGRCPRAPTTILYDHYLKEQSASTISYHNPNNVDNIDYDDAAEAIETYLDAVDLADQNVLLGSWIYGFGLGRAMNYITGAMPMTGSTSTDWGGIHGTYRIANYDATKFQGGNLLCLTGAQINRPSSSAIQSPYFSYELNGMSGLPENEDANDAYIAEELENLAALKARFGNFRQYVYLRRYDNNSQETAIADLMEPLHLALQASLAAHNVTLRGPYGPTEDISAIVVADVNDWLDELEE